MLNITGVNVAKVACFSDWFSDWATKKIKDVKDYLKQTTFTISLTGDTRKIFVSRPSTSLTRRASW